jgi:ferrous iron transport protein B
MSKERVLTARDILDEARILKERLGPGLHDRVAGSLYAKAAEITRTSVRVTGKPRIDWDLQADKILTSRYIGFPIMLAGLAAILWVTIRGANVPSGMLFSGFMWLQDQLEALMNAAGSPWWLTGFLVNGVYRGLAWVVSVMLPPMAIFFPIFTLLEDVGYLPRVAFNLDRFFRWAGAHGKQALTMGMGFGCNAAGVTACRIIDSPRERLIAILTNNFSLCNGRWPTIIMLSSIFVVASFSAASSSAVATLSVAAVAALGVVMTLLVSKMLSKTVLKGEPSYFFLELPPYRVPNVWRVVHRSMIDRTIYVLIRAVTCAAPAGGLIWIFGNVHVGAQSLMAHVTSWMNPFAVFMGLDGVILTAFIIAIPANEIIVPTIIMAYLAQSQMTELEDLGQLSQLLYANGWTLLTAACTMLFSLLHFPCTTTSLTIYRETGSIRWTILANLMPLGIAVLVCALVAQAVRILG